MLPINWPIPGTEPVSAEPVSAEPIALTPMQLVQRALDAGDLNLVERMMALQERWQANEARKAFDAALAEAGAKLPVIVKNRSVDFGKGRAAYRYEDFATIARAVDPVLAEHGLHYRFRTTSDKGSLTVTCIISHRDGHFEENSLTAPFDASGNKNPIQAIGSAQTYLQRYTLKAALGLAAGNDDDATSVSPQDNAETGEVLSQARCETLTEALAMRGMPDERLLKWIRRVTKLPIPTVADIPANRFDQCLEKVQAGNDQ